VVGTEEVRRRLEEQRAKLAERTGKIQQHLQQLPDPDSQERVTETENDEVLERLDGTERAQLAQVEHALQRLDAGTYGVCEGCGEAIAPARLEAIPEAARCVGCA